MNRPRPKKSLSPHQEQLALLQLEALHRSQQPNPVLIYPMDLWLILCQLQLALRHPANNGPASKVARGFIAQVRPRIAPEGSALDQMFECGFDPDYDVPNDKSEKEPQ